MTEEARRGEFALARENEALRSELTESHEVLNAIRCGSVDALVVQGPHGPQVYTLHGADYPYRVFLEAVNEGAVTLASDGTILYANRAFAKLLGQSLEQVGGRNFRELMAPAHRATLDEMLEDRGTLSRRCELRLVSGTGEVPVQLSARRVQTVADAECLCLIVTDLREQHLRDQLAQSEMRVTADLEAITRLYEAGSFCVQPGHSIEQCLERLLDAAIFVARADKGAIQVIDADSGSLSMAAQSGFSARFLAFFDTVGAASATVCGAALASRDRVVVEDLAHSDLLTGTALETMRAEGICAIASTPLVGSSGSLLGVLSVHFARPTRLDERELRLIDLLTRQAADFLERKQAEEDLRRSSERLRLAQQGANMGTFDWDVVRGRIVWSVETERLWGMRAGEFGGSYQDWQACVHPEDRPQADASVQRALADPGQPLDSEYRIVRPDGVVRWIHAKATTLRNAVGQPVRMVGITMDVTERRDAERQLQNFASELEARVEDRTHELLQSQERLRRLATELNLTEQRERKRLATVLHDHLAQVLVLSRLKLGQVLRGPIDPAQALLVRQTDELLGEALTYTRTLVSDLAPPVLHDLGLAAALVWLGDYMRRHDLDVIVDSRSEVGPESLTEAQAVPLFQSVRELLLNVVKHAQAPTARVVLEIRDHRLRIEVRDEGVGFDTASLGTEAALRSPQFGLLSVRERMLALGGSFEIHSEPGGGTCAVLDLPLLRAEPAAQAAVPAPVQAAEHFVDRRAVQGRIPGAPAKRASDRINLLLVDDHTMVRQGLRALLEGHADIRLVGEAANGEEAVALAEQLRPAVIVMDVSMPRVNGIEATTRIKARHPDTLVIGLSVNAGSGNCAAMRKAGAAVLISKDEVVELLYASIREQYDLLAGEAAGEQAEDSEAV